MQLRRFLAFSWAVVKHTRALAIGFFGGLLVALPGLIKPLAPYYPRVVSVIEGPSNALADPSKYLWAGIGLFAAFFYFACFLAWNEERDSFERERKVVEGLSRQLQRDTPELYLIIKQAEYSFLEGRLEALLEIHNLGAATALHGWCGGLGFQDGHVNIVSDNYFAIDESPHFDELLRLTKRGVGNLLHFHGRIERRGKLEGWVSLSVGVHGDDRDNIKEFIFRVLDSENKICESSDDFYFQRRKGT
jgi:hypothetical protein